MCTAETVLPNVATFPMKKPEMQIGQPEVTEFPETGTESEFARNTQTWE